MRRGVRVLGHALFEKIGLAVHRDLLHERKRIRHEIQLGVPKLRQETVGDEPDVLPHEVIVHPNQTDGEALADKLLLDQNGLVDNGVRLLHRDLGHHVTVKKRREIGMKAFVARDPFVALSEAAGHESSLLEPEDGAKTPAEKQSLDDAKGKEPLGEQVGLVIDPAERPLGLFGDAGDGLNGAEQLLFAEGIADKCLNHETISLAVHILHGGLECVEAPGLGDGHLPAEILHEVLEDDAVAPSKKGEDVFDEIFLVATEFGVPIVLIGGEINLLRGPKRILVIFVGLPNVGILNGKEAVTARIVRE